MRSRIDIPVSVLGMEVGRQGVYTLTIDLIVLS